MTTLVDRIGLVSPHWPLEPLFWWLIQGMRHFRIGMEWAEFQPKPDDYQFDAALPAFKAVQMYGGKVLVHLFAVPAWLDPTYPEINGLSFHAIPIMRDEWIEDWRTYLARWTEWIDKRDLHDTVTVAGPIVETNLRGWWEDEHTKGNRSPEDFARLVMAPAKEILNAAGIKMIAGTVTLQGEKDSLYHRALKYFTAYKAKYHLFDHLDIHIYRDKGKELVHDIKRLFGDTSIQHLWISETSVKEINPYGFWESVWQRFIGNPYTPEQWQERNLKDFMRWYISDDPILQKIRRVYFYKSYDSGLGTDGLLNEDFTPKRAANLLCSYVRGDI